MESYEGVYLKAESLNKNRISMPGGLDWYSHPIPWTVRFHETLLLILSLLIILDYFITV